MKEGWTYKKLGEVIDYLRTGLNPRTHFKLNTPDAEGYYITVRELKGFTIEPDEKTDRVNNAAIKRINERSNLKIGDVLFSGTGTIGKTALVSELPDSWNIKEGVYAMTPRHSELDSKYFIYYIGSEFFLRLVNDKAAGTGVRSIPMKELVKLPISVPPLSEQQQIVSYLDSAFAHIDELKANAEKQLNDAKALFQKALEKAMEPKEGWEEKTLGDIATYSIGLTYKPSDVNETGTIVLRSSNIQDDKLDLKDIVRVKCPIKETLYVKEGDILMCSRNGSARLVGKVALLPAMKERMTYGTFMMIIRSKYTPYLFYFFKSDTFRDQIKHGEANMINQITRYMLDDVYVNTPPLSEQQQIVTRLDSLSANIKALEENLEKTISECDALKQALLREVFE